MPMQPSPSADTSSWLGPRVRFFISVVLPQDPPVLAWVRRLHVELVAGQLEKARQVLADEAPDERTFDVISEGPSAGVDLVAAERGLVPALRVLHGAGRRPRLLVPVHDLDRHAAFACEDEHPAAIRLVELPVRAFLFQRDEPPRSG